MKIKSLILAMAACAGLFSACSNELTDEVNGGNETTTDVKDAYASVSFVMPNVAGTRATPTPGQGGDGTEVGSDSENAFDNVKVLLFKDGVLLTEYKELKKSDFAKTQEGSDIVYTTTKDINVASGTYKVYVVLNPTPNFTVQENVTTLTAFQAMAETATQGQGEYCRTNNFMMTNADVIENTEIKQENIKGNAKKIKVHVERIAAKIAYTKAHDSYSFTDSQGNKITVTFDAFKVINTRNSAYNLRRVGMNQNDVTIGGKETGNNYVIENKWAEKATYSTKVFEDNYSRKASQDYVAFRALTATGNEAQTLAYCMENTMLKDMQLNGYSTGIIFRAKATVEGITSAEENYKGDLYKYEGKFYTSLVDLVKSANKDWNGTDETLTNDILKIKTRGEVSVEDYLKGINNIAALEDFGVDYFVQGYCYYTYWLRHANNNDKTMGIMEFAIVRNNVYKVTINTVGAMGKTNSGTVGPKDPAKPGEGEVDNPDPSNPNPEMPGEVVPNPEPTDPVIPFEPENPDESNETYLNVSVYVNPWIVRNNDIDFN